MELTNEQHEIINSSGNIKINAVAGSGKTTTIIEYAKARPPESRILYLAFNKSAAQRLWCDHFAAGRDQLCGGCAAIPEAASRGA